MGTRSSIAPPALQSHQVVVTKTAMWLAAGGGGTKTQCPPESDKVTVDAAVCLFCAADGDVLALCCIIETCQIAATFQRRATKSGPWPKESCDVNELLTDGSPSKIFDVHEILRE